MSNLPDTSKMTIDGYREQLRFRKEFSRSIRVRQAELDGLQSMLKDINMTIASYEKTHNLMTGELL